MPTDTVTNDGNRLDITITHVTLRAVDVGGATVYRLIVEDEQGEQFPVFTEPESETLVRLNTGADYRVTDLLRTEVPSEAETDPDTTCPSCGASLRPGQPVDTVDDAVLEAVEELNVTGPFGVVDEETVIARVQDDDRVDDWRPMQEEAAVSVPDFVCPACGRSVPSHLAVERGVGARPEEAHANVMESPAMESASPSPETVGLAAGGAKDVANFRENVAAGYTPQPEAISDEGLFYDYYFETGEGNSPDTDALFAPRYATAVSDHPFTGETEHYLSVGLDSSLSVDDFDRPRLDLVAVLDVSGSMDSAFDEYYYGEHGRKREAQVGSATKLEAATEALCALTDQLKPEDRLGVVLFNNRAHVAKPLRDIGSTNMVAIRQHIRDVAAGGGTNLADGFEAAWDMVADGETSADVERRVVFMTDMMPNTGATGERTLTQLFTSAADRGIHTTFVGMGLDANAELADALSGIRGANHYFVHSAAEFERRLGAEFEYMITPLVYALELELDCAGAEIAAVHGSPTADDASGRLLHVETLFPSAKEDGEARGGVVLVRLDGAPAEDVDLVASWTERDGTDHSERATVTLPDGLDSYDHNGIRKAVVLSRYARELRAWANEIHQRADGEGVDDWLLPDSRGEHERESVSLAVPDDWVGRFEELRAYLDSEQDAVGDDDLQQEVTLLERLLEARHEAENGVCD